MFNKLKYLKDNKNFLPKNILDIGANIGEFYKLCYSIWPESTYYLVEANKNCEQFLENFGQKYYIELLGEYDDVPLNFYMTSDNNICTGNSVYLENTKHYTKDKLIIETKNTIRADTLFKNLIFDLIKIDTQGSELDILRGATSLLNNTKYVIVETSLKQYNINSPLENDIIEYMNYNGFNYSIELDSHIWPLDDSPFLKKNEVFQRDLLFYKSIYDY